MPKALSLLFLLFACRLCAQLPLDFELLSTQQGLSQGMVFDILQTRDGFLWVGTKDGLNRYDGYRFEVFTHDPFDPHSIRHNETRSLHEDSRGWLWVGHITGLDVYQPENGRFVAAESLGFSIPKAPYGSYSFTDLPDGGFFAISDAAPNKAYFFRPATSAVKGGLDSLGIESAPPNQGSKPSYFTNLFLSKNKTLYVGTDAGLYRIEQDAKPFRLSRVALPGTPVTLLGEDRAGRLWVHTNEGLRALENGSLLPQKIPVLGLWQLGKEGKLWNYENGYLSCWQAADLLAGGVPLFKIAQPASLAGRSPAWSITTFERDKSGVAWFGTNGYGLLKFAPGKRKFPHFFPGSSFRRLTELPGGEISLHSGTMTVWTDATFSRSLPNPWGSKQSEGISNVYSCFDADGNYWATGTLPNRQGGLYRTDAKTKQVRSFPQNCTGLVASKNGKLLFISDGPSLVSFDLRTEQFTATQFEAEAPMNVGSAFWSEHLYEDSQGVVWIYNYPGLIKAVPDGNGWQFTYFRTNPADRGSLSDNFILCLLDDPLHPAQFLWIGTKGGGLNRLDKKTGQLRHFKTANGLPDNVVYGILSDNTGHLWMSTNRGLSRFNLKTESFKNFTATDGLQSDEFNQGSFLKTKNGTLIFGGVNGINAFHPDSLLFNEQAPGTALTRLLVNNQLVGYRQGGNGILASPLNTARRIELAYFQNQVSLEFAALDFTSPLQNLFRYRLEGVDENWVEAGTRNFVQYANLRPGKYVFQVQGSNNDGFWSEIPATLELVIHPPWWKTNLAYCLYLLAFLAGVYAIYRFQINRLQLKNELRFEHREAERLAELDKIKSRFFSNITHEFRTPLTLILEPVRQMLREDPNGKFRERLLLVNSSSEQLLHLVNQLLDLAKLESGSMTLDLRRGDFMETVGPVFQSFLPLAEKKGIALKLKAPQQLPPFVFDKNKVELVLKNLLSNALKFTEAGSVELRLEIERLEIEKLGGGPISNFSISVSDTGIGIGPADLPKIFDRFYQVHDSGAGTGIGLALTKELVELMGGDIAVESPSPGSEGGGTVFTVKIPMREQASEALSSWSEMPEEAASVPIAIGTDFSETDVLVAAAPVPANDEGKPLVLLVEDNAELRHFIKNSLGSRYQVVEASNGAAGIRKALELIPDLVISDLMMPEKNGFEVCNELKTNELTSHIPLVLLTGKSALESKLQGLRSGADEYLTKPFHTEELLARLSNLIANREKLRLKFSGTKPGGAKKALEHFSKIDNDFLRKLNLLIEEHLDDEQITVEDFAAKLFISRVQLHRKLTALTDQSATEFIRNYRLDRALELLKNKEGNVSQVAFMVGFGSEKYFSTTFKERFGLSPSEVV